MTPSNVETEPRSAGQIAEWFTGRQLVIVAETEATGPVAFAASFPYRDRACYSGIGEFSVYVRRDYRGPRRRPRGTRRTSGGGYPLDAVHSLVPFFSPRCRVRRPCETRFGVSPTPTRRHARCAPSGPRRRICGTSSPPPYPAIGVDAQLGTVPASLALFSRREPFLY
jgi:hypothetical protein